MAKYLVSKVVGIDLGTTNSVVALMDPTDTDIVIHKDPNGRATTPSCVWKNPKSGEVVVGRKAFSQIGSAKPPIKSIKRAMGRPDKVRLLDEWLTPEEVSAKVLGEMKRQIEEDVQHFDVGATQWIVDRAIITVPAYFNQPQIDATSKAGEMAGLQVLELLHEPTAAACYHCWRTKTQNGVFLVYDLGGGTFDVSILRCTEGEFEVLGISGNNMLGGDDFDTILAQELQSRLIKDGYALNLNQDNDDDKLRFEKLKRLAEGIKIALSDRTEYLLRDTTTLTDKNEESVELELMFERYELEKLLLPLVERTIPYCFDALMKAEKKAGITLADIDEVILAGGSTHIPLVREMVRKSLCADPAVKEPRAKCAEPVYKNVDTNVALGAAIRAAASGGLAMYDSERTMRITFRGTAATNKKQIHIGGQVEALDGNINLVGGSIRLSMRNQGFEDEQDLKKNGSFGFTGVQLQIGAENLLTFEVYDRNRKLAATVHRALKQSQEVLGPTGGSSGTAINSKAIILEMNSAGQPSLKTLFSEMETLPGKKEHNFSHPGDTDTIRLPFYQNRTKIQEILIKDCKYPRGTPILLVVEMDKLSHITVKGKIGEKPFEADVNLPSQRTAPNSKEIEELDRKFQSSISYLPSGKRAVAEARYRKAKQGYDADVKRADHPHAVHEFEEMEELVASVSQGKGNAVLEPPKEMFDALVRSCNECNRNVMQRSHLLDQAHDDREMARAIEAQRGEGGKAFEAGDQIQYSDAIKMLEAIQSHLIMLLRSTDSRTEAERTKDFIQYLAQEASRLEQLALSTGSNERQDEIKQMKQKLEGLASEIRMNPNVDVDEAYQISLCFQQIENELTDLRKQKELIRGLVEES